MRILNSIQSFVLQCSRVWRIMRKPTKEEFRSISRVSAIGLLAIGLIGFLVAIVVNFLL